MDETFQFFFSFKSSQIYMKDAEWAETNRNRFSDFLVFEIWSFLYSKLFIFLWILSTKSTITRKIKIGKFIKLIFHSIQHCAYLSCEYGHFWGGREGLHILRWEKYPEKKISGRSLIIYSLVVDMSVPWCRRCFRWSLISCLWYQGALASTNGTRFPFRLN